MEKRLKEETGPKISCERSLRPVDAPMKLWSNQPLRRNIEKPSEKPIKQEIVATESKHSLAKMSTSTASVNIEFINRNKEELVDEDDDDYIYYQNLKYAPHECSESRMIQETHQPLKPIPYTWI